MLTEGDYVFHWMKVEQFVTVRKFTTTDGTNKSHKEDCDERGLETKPDNITRELHRFTAGLN